MFKKRREQKVKTFSQGDVRISEGTTKQVRRRTAISDM